MPRPYKLNDRMIDVISRALELGASRKVAAEAAGVHVSTLYAYLAKGKEEDSGKYRELHDRIKKAESNCCLRALSKIQQAAMEGKWQAACWLLERRYPEYRLNHQPVIEVNIDADSLDMKMMISELKRTDDLLDQMSVNGPLIDLDEE